MHTTQGPSGQYYAHNGDFSGAVKVSIPVRPQADYPDNYTSASAPHTLPGEAGEFVEVEIPFEDIRALYLRHIRSERTSWLEQASDDALEKSLIGPQPARDDGPPEHSLPWWAQEKKRQAILRAATPRPSTGKLRVGGAHIHTADSGVLAKIVHLGEDGTVLFSVWNADHPDSWQDGAGLPSHDRFRQLYPTVYIGEDPVTGEELT